MIFKSFVFVLALIKLNVHAKDHANCKIEMVNSELVLTSNNFMKIEQKMIPRDTNVYPDFFDSSTRLSLRKIEIAEWSVKNKQCLFKGSGNLCEFTKETTLQNGEFFDVVFYTPIGTITTFTRHASEIAHSSLKRAGLCSRFEQYVQR